MDQQLRAWERARQARLEYARDLDAAHAWLQAAEETLRDRSAPPPQCREPLAALSADLPNAADREQRVQTAARILLEGSRDADERRAVTEAATALHERHDAVLRELEMRRSACDDACAARDRFLALLERVRAWIQAQREFLARPLTLNELSDAQHHHAEYANAMKSCKQQAKNLADMAKEIEAIERVTSAGELPALLEQVEGATVEVEKILSKTTGLLGELAEEWERCCRKLREVSQWAEAAGRGLEVSPRAPLRDRLAHAHKLRGDVSTQQTRVAYAVEKLKVHFEPAGVARGGQFPPSVGAHAHDITNVLANVAKSAETRIEALTAALQQLDALAAELADLRTQLSSAERDLRRADPALHQEVYQRWRRVQAAVVGLDPAWAAGEGAALVASPGAPSAAAHASYADVLRGRSPAPPARTDHYLTERSTPLYKEPDRFPDEDMQRQIEIPTVHTDIVIETPQMAQTVTIVEAVPTPIETREVPEIMHETLQTETLNPPEIARGRSKSPDLSYAEILALGLQRVSRSRDVTPQPQQAVAPVETRLVEKSPSPPRQSLEVPRRTRQLKSPTRSQQSRPRTQSRESSSSRRNSRRRHPMTPENKQQKKKKTNRVTEVQDFDDFEVAPDLINIPVQYTPQATPHEHVTKIQQSATVVETIVTPEDDEILVIKNEETRNPRERSKSKPKKKKKPREDEIEKALKEIQEADHSKKKRHKESHDNQRSEPMVLDVGKKEDTNINAGEVTKQKKQKVNRDAIYQEEAVPLEETEKSSSSDKPAKKKKSKKQTKLEDSLILEEVKDILDKTEENILVKITEQIDTAKSEKSKKSKKPKKGDKKEDDQENPPSQEDILKTAEQHFVVDKPITKPQVKPRDVQEQIPEKSVMAIKSLIEMDWNALMEEEENISEPVLETVKSGNDEIIGTVDKQVASEVMIIQESLNTTVETEAPVQTQSLEEPVQQRTEERTLIDINTENEQNNNDKFFSERDNTLTMTETNVDIARQRDTHTVYLITHEQKKLPPIRTVKMFSSKSNSLEDTPVAENILLDNKEKDNKITLEMSSNNVKSNVESITTKSQDNVQIHDQNICEIDKFSTNQTTITESELETMMEQAIFGSVQDRRKPVIEKKKQKESDKIPYQELSNSQSSDGLKDSTIQVDDKEDLSKNTLLKEEVHEFDYNQIHQAECLLATLLTTEGDKKSETKFKDENNKMISQAELDSQKSTTQLDKKHQTETEDIPLEMSEHSLLVKDEFPKDNYQAVRDAEIVLARLSVEKEITSYLSSSKEKETENINAPLKDESLIVAQQDIQDADMILARNSVEREIEILRADINQLSDKTEKEIKKIPQPSQNEKTSNVSYQNIKDAEIILAKQSSEKDSEKEVTQIVSQLPPKDEFLKAKEMITKEDKIIPKSSKGTDPEINIILNEDLITTVDRNILLLEEVSMQSYHEIRDAENVLATMSTNKTHQEIDAQEIPDIETIKSCQFLSENNQMVDNISQVTELPEINKIHQFENLKTKSSKAGVINLNYYEASPQFNYSEIADAEKQLAYETIRPTTAEMILETEVMQIENMVINDQDTFEVNKITSDNSSSEITNIEPAENISHDNKQTKELEKSQYTLMSIYEPQNYSYHDLADAEIRFAHITSTKIYDICSDDEKENPSETIGTVDNIVLQTNDVNTVCVQKRPDLVEVVNKEIIKTQPIQIDEPSSTVIINYEEREKPLNTSEESLLDKINNKCSKQSIKEHIVDFIQGEIAQSQIPANEPLRDYAKTGQQKTRAMEVSTEIVSEPSEEEKIPHKSSIIVESITDILEINEPKKKEIIQADVIKKVDQSKTDIENFNEPLKKEEILQHENVSLETQKSMISEPLKKQDIIPDNNIRNVESIETEKLNLNEQFKQEDIINDDTNTIVESGKASPIKHVQPVSDETTLVKDTTRAEKSPIHNLHDLLPEIDSIPEFKPSNNGSNVIFSNLSADAPEFKPSYLYQSPNTTLPDNSPSVEIETISSTISINETFIEKEVERQQIQNKLDFPTESHISNEEIKTKRNKKKKKKEEKVETALIHSSLVKDIPVSIPLETVNVWAKMSEDGKTYADVVAEGLPETTEIPHYNILSEDETNIVAKLNPVHSKPTQSLLELTPDVQPENTLISENIEQGPQLSEDVEGIHSSWAKIVASHQPSPDRTQKTVVKNIETSTTVVHKTPVIYVEESEMSIYQPDIEVDADGFITVERSRRSRSRSQDNRNRSLSNNSQQRQFREKSQNRFEALISPFKTEVESTVSPSDGEECASNKKERQSREQKSSIERKPKKEEKENKRSKKDMKKRSPELPDTEIKTETTVQFDTNSEETVKEIEKPIKKPSKKDKKKALNDPLEIQQDIIVKEEALAKEKTQQINEETSSERKKNKKKKKQKGIESLKNELVKSDVEPVEENSAVQKTSKSSVPYTSTPVEIQTPVKERQYSEAQFWKIDSSHLVEELVILPKQSSIRDIDVSQEESKDQKEESSSEEMSLETKMADLQREIEEMLSPENDTSISDDTPKELSDVHINIEYKHDDTLENLSPSLASPELCDDLLIDCVSDTYPDISSNTTAQENVKYRIKLDDEHVSVSIIDSVLDEKPQAKYVPNVIVSVDNNQYPESKAKSQDFVDAKQQETELEIKDVVSLNTISHNVLPDVIQPIDLVTTNTEPQITTNLKSDNFWTHKFIADDAEKMYHTLKVDERTESNIKSIVSADIELDNSLEENMLRDNFWPEKHLYHDAEYQYFLSISKKPEQPPSNLTEIDSKDQNDKDKDPGGSSGHNSEADEPKYSFGSPFDSNYVSMDLPGGVCSWKDQSSYLSLESPCDSMMCPLEDTPRLASDAREDILTTSLEPVPPSTQEPAPATDVSVKDELSNGIESLLEEVKNVQTRLADLPDDSLDAMENGLREGVEILVKCEEAATLLEQKIMEIRHEPETEALLTDLVLMKNRIAKLLGQAKQGLDTIKIAKEELVKQNEEIEEQKQKIIKLDQWLGSINNELTLSTNQNEVLIEEEIIKYIEIYERYIREYEEYEILLRSITVISRDESSQSLGEKINSMQNALEETKKLVIVEVERLRQLLVQIRSAVEIREDDISETDRTIDSTSMPEEVVTPRAEETVVESKTSVKEQVEIIQHTKPTTNIETQTGKSLMSDAPSIADKSVICKPEQKFTQDVSITCAPPQEIQTQTSESPSLEKEILQNIQVKQTISEGHETIEIASRPVVREQKHDEHTLLVNADYLGQDLKKDSQLNITHSLPQSFETVMVEPDETTTEVVVDADGTKRIIVKKVRKTLISRQQVLHGQDTTQMLPIEGEQSYSQITLKENKGSTSTQMEDGTVQRIQYQTYGGQVISQMPGEEVTIQEFTSKPETIIQMSQDMKPDEILQLADGQGQTHIQTTSSGITAVVQQVTKRIVQTRRRIIRKIIIIDGKEHVTEEVIDEPDSIEVVEEQIPKVSINIKDKGGVQFEEIGDKSGEQPPSDSQSQDKFDKKKPEDDADKQDQNKSRQDELFHQSEFHTQPSNIQELTTEFMKHEGEGSPFVTRTQSSTFVSQSREMTPEEIAKITEVMSTERASSEPKMTSHVEGVHHSTIQTSSSQTSTLVQKITRKITRIRRRIIKHIQIIDGKEHVTEEVIEEPEEVEIVEDAPTVSTHTLQEHGVKTTRKRIIRQVQIIDGKEHVSEQIVEEPDDEYVPDSTIAAEINVQITKPDIIEIDDKDQVIFEEPLPVEVTKTTSQVTSQPEKPSVFNINLEMIQNESEHSTKLLPDPSKPKTLKPNEEKSESSESQSSKDQKKKDKKKSKKKQKDVETVQESQEILYTEPEVEIKLTEIVDKEPTSVKIQSNSEKILSITHSVPEQTEMIETPVVPSRKQKKKDKKKEKQEDEEKRTPDQDIKLESVSIRLTEEESQEKIEKTQTPALPDTTSLSKKEKSPSPSENISQREMLDIVTATDVDLTKKDSTISDMTKAFLETESINSVMYKSIKIKEGLPQSMDVEAHMSSEEAPQSKLDKIPFEKKHNVPEDIETITATIAKEGITTPIVTKTERIEKPVSEEIVQSVIEETATNVKSTQPATISIETSVIRSPPVTTTEQMLQPTKETATIEENLPTFQREDLPKQTITEVTKEMLLREGIKETVQTPTDHNLPKEDDRPSSEPKKKDRKKKGKKRGDDSEDHSLSFVDGSVKLKITETPSNVTDITQMENIVTESVKPSKEQLSCQITDIPQRHTTATESVTQVTEVKPPVSESVKDASELSEPLVKKRDKKKSKGKKDKHGSKEQSPEIPEITDSKDKIKDSGEVIQPTKVIEKSEESVTEITSDQLDLNAPIPPKSATLKYDVTKLLDTERQAALPTETVVASSNVKQPDVPLSSKTVDISMSLTKTTTEEKADPKVQISMTIENVESSEPTIVKRDVTVDLPSEIVISKEPAEKVKIVEKQIKPGTKTVAAIPKDVETATQITSEKSLHIVEVKPIKVDTTITETDVNIEPQISEVSQVVEQIKYDYDDFEQKPDQAETAEKNVTQQSKPVEVPALESGMHHKPQDIVQDLKPKVTHVDMTQLLLDAERQHTEVQIPEQKIVTKPSQTVDISMSLSKTSTTGTDPRVYVDMKVEHSELKGPTIVKKDIDIDLPTDVRVTETEPAILTEEVKAIPETISDQKRSKNKRKRKQGSEGSGSFDTETEFSIGESSSTSLSHYVELQPSSAAESPKPTVNTELPIDEPAPDSSLAESIQPIEEQGYEPEDVSLEPVLTPEKSKKQKKRRPHLPSEDTTYPKLTTADSDDTTAPEEPAQQKKIKSKKKGKKTPSELETVEKKSSPQLGIEIEATSPKEESYHTMSETPEASTVKVVEECVHSSPDQTSEVHTTLTYPVPVVEQVVIEELSVQTSPEAKEEVIHQPKPEITDSELQTSPTPVSEIPIQTTPVEDKEAFTQTIDVETIVEKPSVSDTEIQTDTPDKIVLQEVTTQVTIQDVVEPKDKFSQTSPVEELTETKETSPKPIIITESKEMQTSPSPQPTKDEKSTEVVIETSETHIQTTQYETSDRETETSPIAEKEIREISMQTPEVHLVSAYTQSDTPEPEDIKQVEPDIVPKPEAKVPIKEVVTVDSTQQTTPRYEPSPPVVLTQREVTTVDNTQQTSPREYTEDSISTSTEEPYEVHLRAQISIPQATSDLLESERQMQPPQSLVFDDKKQKKRKNKRKAETLLYSPGSLSDPITTELSVSVTPTSEDFSSKDISSIDEGISQLASPIPLDSVMQQRPSYSAVVQRSKSKSPSPSKSFLSQKPQKARLLDALEKRTEATKFPAEQKSIKDDSMAIVLYQSPVQNSYDLVVNKEIDDLKQAVESRNPALIEKHILVVIETISIWLEEIHYKIERETSSGNKTTEETEKLKSVQSYIQHLKEIIEITEVNEEIITLIETLTRQTNAVNTLSNQSSVKVKEVQKDWHKFINEIEIVSKAVHNVKSAFDTTVLSEAPIQHKLDRLEQIEGENINNSDNIARLFRRYKSFVDNDPKTECPVKLYNCNDDTKQLENSINAERDRLLQLTSLIEEYEQTLQDFGQITDVAEALLDGKITVSNLNHLHEEIQKHRKFFVNLSHCRAILESLEDNLDNDTKAKYASLHNSLHDRATVIIDRAASRAQQMTLAASRWSTLNQGMKEEQQWLRVAQQRIPDLVNVTSIDHEQYINLYQSVGLDVNHHHAKILRLMSITEALQNLISCSGLENECSTALDTLLKLQEEIDSRLTRLTAFKEHWSTYDHLIDRIEIWIKVANQELENVSPENITTTGNLRKFWELKAQHEVCNNLKIDSGSQFERALEILPVSDEMVQRQFFSDLEDKWQKLASRFADLHSAAIQTISDRDVTSSEKLRILEEEILELRNALEGFKGVIKSEDELNLYIERLQVMTARIDRIQNELGRLSLVPGGEADRLGALLSRSAQLHEQLAAELERAALLRERMGHVRLGLDRADKNQRRTRLALDECQAAERLAGPVVERALARCAALLLDLEAQWRDALRLRDELHALPVRLRVAVSAGALQRALAALQAQHAALLAAQHEAAARLRARLQLWRRWDLRLDALHAAVRDADYLQELLTVQGQVDYHRLLKATERLETLSESLSRRSGELVGELREAATPLESSTEPDVAAALRRELDDACAAYEHTKSNLNHLCDKYHKAVELWSRYRDAAAAVRAFTDQHEGSLHALRPHDAPRALKACLEQEARVTELRSLAARVAAETGSQALQADADALARRLQLVAGAVQALADLGEARQHAREKANSAKEKLCDMKQDLAPLHEDGEIVEDKLIALRENLIEMGRREADISPAKAELPEIDRDVSDEHSIVRILELWQAMFRETFLHYHRLSTALIRSGDAATALRLWHEYLLDLQSFLSGSVPADYENLTEHRRLCRVHRNLLASQRSILVSENREVQNGDLSDKFDTLTNLHNETLSRIVERHDEVSARIAAWDDYRDRHTELLRWLNEIEREKEKLQLRYVHIKRINKILTKVQNLTNKIPEGRRQSEKLHDNLKKVLEFTDDTYGASVRMEYAGIAKRVDNLHASLDTWRDFLTRILGMIGEYEKLTSDLHQLYAKTQDDITGYSDEERLSRPQIKKAIEKYTNLKNKIDKTEAQIEALSVIQEQLKECLSPQDIRMVNQRIWQLRQNRADLEHQLSIIIYRLQERLEVYTIFDTRVTRFVDWLKMVEYRLETSSNESERGILDPHDLIRRITSDVEAETALKEREFEWLSDTGSALVDLAKKDEKSYSKNTSKHLKDIQNRWYKLQETGRNRIAKINELLETIQQLEQRLMTIREKLHSVESKLSSAVVLEQLNTKAVDEKFIERDNIQKEIENESSDVGETLNHCELIFNDPDILNGNFDLRNLRTGYEIVEKKWKNICEMSEQRKNTLKEIRKSAELATSLLPKVDKKLDAIEKRVEKVEFRKQKGETEDESVSKSIIKDLDALENDVKRLDETYNRIASSRGIELRGKGADDFAKLRNAARRWKLLRGRVESVDTDAHRQFVAAHGKAVVALAETDVKLTTVLHLSPATDDKAIVSRQLDEVYQQLSDCRLLISEAERLSSSVQGIPGISDMRAEYNVLCEDVATRLEMARAAGREVDEAVQVDTLQWETDASLQVDTLTSKETYRSELVIAVNQATEHLEALTQALNQQVSQDTPGDELAAAAKHIAKVGAKPAQHIELAKHLSELLLTECDASESEAMLKEVGTLALKYEDLLSQAKKRELQINNLRLPHSSAYSLTCEHTTSGLSCPLCSSRNWVQLDNDLWRLEQWLQVAEATDENRTSPPQNYEALEDAIQDHREFLLDLDSHKSLVVSLNVVAEHVSRHGGGHVSQQVAAELRARLQRDNQRWDEACARAAAWHATLQHALVDNQQFHDIVVELVQTLSAAERSVRSRDAQVASGAGGAGGADRLRRQYRRMCALHEELRAAEPRVLALHDTAQLLRGSHHDHAADLCTRLSELRLRLQSLRKLSGVYALKLGAALAAAAPAPGAALAAAASAVAAPTQLLEESEELQPMTLPPIDDNDSILEEHEEQQLSRVQRGLRFVCRVARASLPFQALLLLLLGAAALAPNATTDCRNTPNFTPVLRYPDGPPPL